MNKFDNSLLGSGELMRRAEGSLVNNSGRAVALITLIVAALVTFTDLSFYGAVTRELTASVLIMLIASYLIYFSMEDTGEKAFEATEEYTSAMEKYIKLRDRIDGKMMPELRIFCKEYSEEELKFRRESLLISYGESLPGYEEYKNGAVITERKRRRIFRKAERLRSVELTPKLLLSRDHSRARSELSDPEAHKFLSMAVKLIPTAVCMLVTVSIIPSIKDDMSASTVIEGILKLSSLPIIAFRGYSAGFFHVKRRTVPWIETKTRLISAFLSERLGAGEEAE